MSILTSRTLPRAVLTTFSSSGVSCLHGPHQVAQKSTSTGTFDWTTSLAKVSRLPSTIQSSPFACAGAGAVPVPNNAMTPHQGKKMHYIGR
jgi:hypothetical protein